MRNNFNGKINLRLQVLTPAVLFLLILQTGNAQVVSLNGAYVSTSSGTVVKIDTFRVNSSSINDNAGTQTLSSLVNAGTIQGNGTYNIADLFTNTGTFTCGTSLVNFNGNSNQNIPGLTFSSLTVSGTGSVKTATGNAAVNGTLTINSGDTINMVSYSMSGNPSSIAGTGLLQTQNTSSAPIPAGKTWTGPVYYNGSSAQTIIYGNYTDLVASGGNRVLDNGGTIGISGVFTVGSGTYTVDGSTVNFNSSGAQTVPAFTFENITVSGGNTKSLGGNINLTGALTLGTSTTLGLGSNNIKLKSDSTYTGRIATIPSSASITYGSGRFIAERYVKGRRKYRLITSPVTSSNNSTLTTGEEGLSIWGNWQNQGNTSTAFAGTFITGGNSSDGFDTQTPNASLFTYNSTSRIFEGYTTSNGKNTKYTPLKAGTPYFMFVWGDRTNSPLASSPNKTVLASTGKVLTGDQTYNTSSTIPLSNTVDGYSLIGNPFASPIDWGTIGRTNISNTFWGWDPNLNSTGGYVTVSSTGTTTLISPFSGTVELDQYIQSGQGFFVKTTAASPVLVIHETDKVANYNPLAFRTQVNSIPLIAVNLMYTDAGSTLLMDGALAAFDTSFSNLAGKEDASKILKSGEGLSIKVGAELLSINARKMPLNGDTLYINTAGLTKPQYSLQVFAKQMETVNLEPWLEDTYLKTSRLLSLTDTNNIPFTINSAIAASYSPDRFHIVFRRSGDQSDIITSIRATKESNDVRVDWNVNSETGVQKYEVQRADDANSFTRLGDMNAVGQPSYYWMDNNPATGTNHYRLRIIKTDGSYSFSKIATVTMPIVYPAITAMPNPVVNHTIHLRLVNIEKGKYSLRLFDRSGRLIMQQGIVHDGGTGNFIIQVGPQVAAGNYFMQLINEKEKYNQSIIIK